jgi:6-phospho-3-hexuloisomerase
MPNNKNLGLSFKRIIQSLVKLQKEIDASQLEKFIKVLVDTFSSGKNVFLYGFGRSLLVGKSFSMRLMHLGFNSHVIGEVVTPPVNPDDVFLTISRTLSNELISVAIDKAKNCKAKIIVISSKDDSYLLIKADNFVIVPDFKSNTANISEMNAPLGTLFEISTMMLLDCVVIELMSRLGITENDMEARHANIQ